MPLDQHMKRREFIALVGGAAAVASRPFPAFAQTSSKRPLIAVQLGGSKTETDRFFVGFFEGMRELGKATITGWKFATATAM